MQKPRMGRPRRTPTNKRTKKRIPVKMKNLYTVFALFFCCAKMLAQAPAWSVSPADFANSMSLTCQVNVDGNPENGAANLLCAFVNGEVRGVASPQVLGGEAYYFLTVHSNVSSGEEVVFQTFLDAAGTIHPAVEVVIFQHNGSLGSFTNPLEINFSSDNDFPISLLPIAPQSAFQGSTAGVVCLDSFLVSVDHDPVGYAVANGSFLQASIGPGNLLTAQPFDPTWSGTDSVLVTATEVGTAMGYSASQYVAFTVMASYADPVFGYVPRQFVQPDLPLPGGDLNDWLDFSGPCLNYGVRLDLPTGETPAPAWVQPTSNSGTMTLNVEVQYNGQAMESGAHRLAGFVGGQLAGVAAPTLFNGKWMYFLTLANVGSGDIRLEFYDANRQFLHQRNTGLTFVPTGQVGTPVAPMPVDYSPILVSVLPDGTWSTTVATPGWTGEQTGQFFAEDCDDSAKKDSVVVQFEVNRCPAQTLSLSTWDALCLHTAPDVSGALWFMDGVAADTGETVGIFEEGNFHYEGENTSDCPIVVGCPVVVKLAGPDVLQSEISTHSMAICDSTFLAPTINDVTPPVAVCQNIDLYLDENGVAEIIPENVDGGSSASCGIDSLAIGQSDFSCAHLGANDVVLTVFDLARRADACTASVMVLDTISPKAVCQNINVYLNADGQGSIEPADLDGGSTDNCSVASLSISQKDFDCGHLGQNNVVMTAHDVVGLTDDCTATVMVLDTMPPDAVCQNLTVYLDASGRWSITPAELENGSTDNCSVDSLSINQADFDCGHLGQNNVVLTAHDVVGLTDDCTSIVAVLDTISPQAVCQNLTVYLDENGVAGITAVELDGGSTDNCAVTSFSATQYDFDCGHLGPNSVAMTAHDVSGNTDVCVAMVTALDTISPEAACQNLTVYLDENGAWEIAPAELNGGSMDNCGVDSLSISQSDFHCGHLGPNEVELSVFDISKNTDVCTAVVTVVDNAHPEAVCQNLTIYLNANGERSITAAQVDGGSADNCGVASLAVSQSDFDCGHLGPNTVYLTASDGVGLTDVCTANVMVKDTVRPAAICQDLTITLNPDGSFPLDPTALDNGSSDNCGGLSFAADPPHLYCNNIGEKTVTLNVSDASGNVGKCVSTVTVEPFFKLLDIVVGESNCGQSNGSIQVLVTALGGQLAYSINGGASWQLQNSFHQLSVGSYHLKLIAQGTYGCEKDLGWVEVGAANAPLWQKDMDGDGYTDGLTLASCTQPTGYVASALPGDCDDDEPAIHPGAPEICNGLDDDCDGEVDEDGDCPGYCPNAMTLSGDISSGTFQVAVQLDSDGTVQNDSTVVLKAGNGILLGAGFEVKMGGSLEAKIEACTESTGN